MKRTILIADDDPGIRESLEERFRAGGFDILLACDGQEALEAARSLPDVVLLDMQMPKLNGIDVLKKMKEEGIELTVLVITAFGTVEKAVEAMKEGAWDFIQKPFDSARVTEAVDRAMERETLVRQNRVFRSTASAPFFLARDPKSNAILETAKKAAVSDTTLLLLGESGTGKEVLARQIHEWSPRAGGPFITVNCVALAETLLESELFGHEKGSFTGASERRHGKFELAHGGTIFLDEIGDITPAFQAKLLRVLQERTFERVGGSKELKTDVRILSATHRNLSDRVQQGSFREDLFHRLNVIPIILPPLRQRTADLRPLAEHFLSQLQNAAGRKELVFSDCCWERMASHPWPGNLRELKNRIERAVVLLNGEEIGPDDLLSDVPPTDGTVTGEGYHDRVATFRRQLLQETLDACQGKRTRAAEKLELQRTYFARLLKQHGL